MESKDIKLKLSSVVTQWEKNNPTEFALFLDGRRAKTENLKNEFGDMTKTTNFIERVLFEVPETLNDRILAALDEGELAWFHSRAGALWFAKSFKQYTIPERV